MGGRWWGDSTQGQSVGWVMGGDLVKGEGQVRSASQTRVHNYWVIVPWCVWVTWATWVSWAIWAIWALDEKRSRHCWEK